jgi:O-antigen ligase
MNNPALPFFLLPFFMMSGVALQTAGVYLCLVLWVFVRGQDVGFASHRAILSTASLLAVAYLIPIVFQSVLATGTNPLQYCFVDPPRVLDCKVTLKTWLKSPTSSLFIGLAVGWTLYVLTRKNSRKQSPAHSIEGLNVLSDDGQRVRGFSRGLLYATLIFFAYSLYQHLTGFSLLLKTKILADEHRMPNGTYRIFGFYGHPLSLAGASLVWSSTALYGLWTELRSRNALASGLSTKGWAVVALLQSALVYMSGGRMALAVLTALWLIFVLALALAVLLPRFTRTRKAKLLAQASLGGAVLGSIAVAGWGLSTGVFANLAERIFSRGLGGGTLGQGPLGDRELFWQVYLSMWRDSPLLGQGYFAVEHGLRTEYYMREGLASLRDKFNAHNIFLEILGISGVVGLLAYMTVCVLLGLNMKILAGRSPQRRFILGSLVFAFFANLLHGLTQNTFFDSAVTACYLALIGLLVVPPFKHNPKTDSASAPMNLNVRT